MFIILHYSENHPDLEGFSPIHKMHINYIGGFKNHDSPNNLGY